MSETIASQAPTTVPVASSFSGIMALVMHPAFRLGFLDAQAGLGLDHDYIGRRISTETPPGALSRLGYASGLFDQQSIEIAQYRYEEGREVFVRYTPKVRAWGHPDYPPVSIRDLCQQLAKERASSVRSEE